MKNIDLVRRLGERLMPLMREEAARISEEIPFVKAHFDCFPLEEAIEHGSHHNFGISCLLPNTPPDEPDQLDLVVGIFDLQESPKVNADICWGHPSGKVELELYPQRKVVSEEVLNEVEAAMPTFFAKLRELLKGD